MRSIQTVLMALAILAGPRSAVASETPVSHIERLLSYPTFTLYVSAFIPNRTDPAHFQLYVRQTVDGRLLGDLRRRELVGPDSWTSRLILSDLLVCIDPQTGEVEIAIPTTDANQPRATRCAWVSETSHFTGTIQDVGRIVYRGKAILPSIFPLDTATVRGTFLLGEWANKKP